MLMLKLYFVKAGDEMNNADFLVWANTAKEAVALWSDMGHMFDLDRVWEFPSAPDEPGVVEWPEPAFTA